MGKQARIERIQKRKNYVKELGNKKLKNRIIIFGVLVVVAIIVGYSAFIFSENMSNVPVLPSDVGVLGSEHTHQGILVMLYGELMDFSIPDYQVRDRMIHFEGQEGFTIHRHATGVSIGYFLETLGFRFDKDCISFDRGDFCSDGNNSWRFFVNSEPIDSIQDYVGNEDSRILITYGNLIPAELSAQLDMVKNKDFKK